MIFEIRTYNCLPDKAPQVLERLSELVTGSGGGPLAGCWFTDIGPLHQAVQLNQYANDEEVLHSRALFDHATHWPQDAFDDIANVQSQLYDAAPFCPSLELGPRGPVYEMRLYSVRPGRFEEVSRRWQLALPARLELSPLLVAMISRNGPLDHFVHIWPYQSLQQRSDVRNRAVAMGVWPPKGSRAFSLRQENKILLPASFSPLQ